MFSVRLEGDREVIQRLSSLPNRVRAALLKKTYALAIQLADRVRRKLSGEVLNVRSGDLRASIFEDVQSDATSVVGRVASSGDVRYAAIHEYGGTIPAHEIVPSKAQALMFVVGGKTVFARRVQIPDVQMPERSFMRSSLSEMKQQIVDGLAEAAREGAREAMRE